MDNSAEKQRQKAVIRIDKAIAELPLLPSAVCNLMALSTNDNKYFEKVYQYAEQDPTFALRIIKLANSAASAPREDLTSIKQAVIRIGSKQIKNLATAFAVTKIFVPSNKSERNLWLHAIQLAVASQTIAGLAVEHPVDPEKAYLCGLLHDIGRFVLFSLVPDGPLKIDEKDWKTPDELIEAEQEAVGTDHAKLGAYAAKKWTLPSELANVISNHHNYVYSLIPSVDKNEAALIRIVQMADFFSVLLMVNPDILFLPAKQQEALIEKHCCHPAWGSPPIKAVLLQKQAQKINDKALKTIAGLGINIDE